MLRRVLVFAAIAICLVAAGTTVLTASADPASGIWDLAYDNTPGTIVCSGTYDQVISCQQQLPGDGENTVAWSAGSATTPPTTTVPSTTTTTAPLTWIERYCAKNPKWAAKHVKRCKG